MSLTLSFEIEKADLTGLERYREIGTDPAALNRAAAEGVKVPIQENFRRLAGSNKNRFGAPSSFWGRMNAGTVSGANATQGWVRMPREVAARYFGTTIRPTGGRKYLSVPARTEAYGKSPREFKDLHPIPFASGSMALVQNTQTQLVRFKSGKRKGQLRPDRSTTVGGGVFFWLVPAVTIRPNPGVLPSETELRAGGRRGLTNYLNVLRSRAQRAEGGGTP